MKKIIIIALLFFIFILPVNAEEYQIDGTDRMESALPDDVNDYFYNNGIDIESTDWVKNLNTKNVFSHIWGFLRDGANTPIKAGGGVIAIILITAALKTLSPEKGAFPAAAYVSILSTVGIIAIPVYSCVSAAVNAIKGCSVFMLSFIPIFGAIVAISGGTVTSAAMSGLLITAAEAVSAAASFIILPFMGAYLAVGICSAASPLTSNGAIAESIKKIAIWILSLITTVFIGILSIQTAVNAAADSLALRTSKFIVGTAVPIAGGAISEAISTVTASMQLLKSTAGIYAVVALSLILIPIICELVIWRLIMAVLVFVSDATGEEKTSQLIKTIDSMLALLIGITLLVGVMFIISLTVVINTVKGQ
ncbi:MAG: hypothetical protein IKK24_00305 [Clostridia bacterium]|nr:hypothetical protein [Clostridia bacterium]